MQKFLLTIDLNTTRLNAQSYSHLIENIPSNNLEIHIYNYIEQKHNKLPFVNNEIIHNYNGSRKKVALDIPQALDTIELCAKNAYLQVFILCGEFESDFLFNKLNDMNVNYQKIMQTSLRQAETAATVHNTEIMTKHNQVFYNNTTDIVSHIDFEQDSNLDTNESLILSEESKENNHTKHDINIITDRLSEIKSNELTTYTPSQKNNKTKLTTEQIKKIYTYIKLKQLRREIN